MDIILYGFETNDITIPHNTQQKTYNIVLRYISRIEKYRYIILCDLYILTYS